MIFNKNKKPYLGQKFDLKNGTEVAPFIYVYDNIIENSQELIDFSLLFPEKWRDSKVISKNFEDVVDKEFRNTRILDISPTFYNDIVWFEVSQIIWLYADRYASENNISFSDMEYSQLLHYSTKEGFYKAHADSSRNMPRIFSAVLYLNDVEEGGETYFNNFDIGVSPRAGRLVLFPANFVYKHEAKTPKSNDKFSIVTWFVP